VEYRLLIVDPRENSRIKRISSHVGDRGMLRGNRFPGLEVPIDRISRLSFSLSFPLHLPPGFSCLLFLSRQARRDLPLSLSLSSAFARTLARRGSFIAFHFRDELTRSIRAWQKCNAREVRGHRLRSHACEGEKQGPPSPRQGFIRDLHCAGLVSARPQGRACVTKPAVMRVK